MPSCLQHIDTLQITIATAFSLLNTIQHRKTEMFKLSVLSLSLLIGSVHAFSPMAGQNVGTKLSMSADDNVDSRRSFFTKSAGSAAIAALSLVNVPEPAQAIGGALKKVNARLIQ